MPSSHESSPLSDVPDDDSPKQTSPPRTHKKKPAITSTKSKQKKAQSNSVAQKRARKVSGSTVEQVLQVDEEDLIQPSTKRRKREQPSKSLTAAQPLHKVIVSESVIIREREASTPSKSPKKRRKETELKSTEEDIAEKVIIDEERGEEEVDIKIAKKTRRKRKTKEEKEAEAMPLAARTVGSKLFVGAHVSIAGGVQHSVTNSVHIGYALIDNMKNLVELT
jgi:AP endonuclease 1